jgi:replicative DNA helicase
VGAISRRLKTLAREIGIPIVALAQLRRAADERKNERPRLSDLRESGSLEQDADTVILLHPDPADHWVIEAIVAKQRNGPRGEVNLVFRKKFTRFENYTPRLDGPLGD